MRILYEKMSKKYFNFINSIIIIENPAMMISKTSKIVILHSKNTMI